MLSLLKRTLSAALTAALLVLLGSPLSPTAYAYTDDAGGQWYSQVIQQAQDYGLMSGYPDGRFGVGDDISRAEFVAVLCRMFSWEAVVPEAPTFSDCPLKEWFSPWVEAAAGQGILEEGALFRPNLPISREEMAVMLVKALGYGDLAQGLDSSSTPFTDIAGRENAGYIAMAYHIGMTGGVPGPDGALQFLPDHSARREEAATMLVKVYERMGSTTQWLHGFYAFSSFSQIDLGEQMDLVSLGWARLCVDPETGPWLNSTRTGGNEWTVPDNPSAALDRLAAAGVPCHLNVYADVTRNVPTVDQEGQPASTSVLEVLLTQPEAAAQAIQALVAAAEDYAGLTIDFEGLKSDAWREPYAAFLADLRSALPEGKALFVCVPPDLWYKAYDYRAIGEAADKVILMAHDYQWTSVPEDYVGTDQTYSPVTPLAQIYTALQHITDAETGVQDRSKIALQISFGTAGFHVDEQGVLLDTAIYHPGPDTIARRLAQEDTVYTWDQASRNPYIEYTTEDGEHYKLWFENAPSVEAKLRLARMFGVTGVSVWRLGTIPHQEQLENYDVWPVFADRSK